MSCPYTRADGWKKNGYHNPYRNRWVVGRQMMDKGSTGPASRDFEALIRDEEEDSHVCFDQAGG